MNTITDQLDRKSSGVHDISPQLYQRVPDAGSRGNVTLSLIAASRYLRPNMKVSKQFFLHLSSSDISPENTAGEDATLGAGESSGREEHPTIFSSYSIPGRCFCAERTGEQHTRESLHTEEW